jgi:two-component system alkaline phosphatase synthesis response regulator PhoP
MKLLIVDDDESIRELVSATLESEDIQLLFAENGIEAYEIAKKEKPDFILLDIMMPKMDGITACKKIKNDENTKNIYIVILTAKVTEEDKKKGYEAGADDYFTKPFSPTDLLDKLEEIKSKK